MEAERVEKEKLDDNKENRDEQIWPSLSADLKSTK